MTVLNNQTTFAFGHPNAAKIPKKNFVFSLTNNDKFTLKN